MATKTLPFDYITIDEPRFLSSIEAYFRWKDLNSHLKNFANRGINMPDAISEPLGCWVLNYVWNRGSSGDATDVVTNGQGNLKIEFKASSNFDSDLSSFGPETNFDKLFFLRFSLKYDLLFVYDLGLTGVSIGEFPVNSREKLKDQQKEGRRPRIRIIEEIIIKNRLAPLYVLSMATHKKTSGLTFEQAEYYGTHGSLPSTNR